MRRSGIFAALAIAMLIQVWVCAAQDDGFTSVEHNDDWTPIIQEFNGVEMVLVPAGCFMMGSEDGEADERPIHEQCFDEPFWIDRYEVTNGQYGSAGCDPNIQGMNQPRLCISWFDARDYCESLGGRLPTEAEWEYAARGPDNLRYPWGNDFVAENVVYLGSQTSDDPPSHVTADVGSRPGGISWVGAYDLSGNGWEWTSTILQSYPYDANDGREDMDSIDVERVLRGGSYALPDAFSTATFRHRVIVRPGGPIGHSGFRCARDYELSDDAVEQSTPETTTLLDPDTIELAQTGVAGNADWTPVIQEFDGMEMVLIPAGCFRMGNDPAALYHDWDTDREVVGVPDGGIQCFDEPFWMDRYEVTNAQYGSVGCADQSSQPNQPRNCVSWFDALDFCARRGGRLPTEAEWEYAARGPDALTFPWGNDFVEDNVVCRANSGGQTAIVGSHPGGISWVGAHDLSGNLMEWTSTIYQSYPYNAADGREDNTNADSTRVLRGGVFDVMGNGLRVASHGEGGYPVDERYFSGFRCVRDYATGD